MALEVVRVPVLSDNYAWLLQDESSGGTAIVDPGEAQPLLDAAARRDWTIGQVWITHWHPDHTGGVTAVKQATGATVTGPEAERGKFDGLDVGVGEGDTVRLGDHVATVLETPGHTAGHIVFHFADDALAFTGDTLFAMGCGRLFEGSAAQMCANMRRFAAMPPATQIYCGHEYTQANGRFARVAEPDNAEIVARMVEVDAARAAGKATIPTTIALEQATNPFLRAASADELADLRRAKDEFRG